MLLLLYLINHVMSTPIVPYATSLKQGLKRFSIVSQAIVAGMAHLDNSVEVLLFHQVSGIQKRERNDGRRLSILPSVLFPLYYLLRTS